MRLLVVPTAAAGINFEADVACMCSAAIGTVVDAAVLLPPGMHCSLAVVAATAVVLGVVATVAASDAGAAIVYVSVLAVVAGAVAAGVATWFLSDVFAFHAAFLSSTNLTFSICFVIIHPRPASVPSGNSFVLGAHACTFVHVGLITFDISPVNFFWHDGGKLYPSWSTSYPQDKQYSKVMCCFRALEYAFLVLLVLRRSPL